MRDEGQKDERMLISSAWFIVKETVIPVNSPPHTGDPGKLMDDDTVTVSLGCLLVPILESTGYRY